MRNEIMHKVRQSRFCLLLLLPVLIGCGGPSRLNVEGTVTLDGKPLEKGAIQFCPQTGTPGPTAGGDVVGGAFAIPASQGPLAGKFSVQITATGPTGRKVFDERSRGMIEEYAQYIPAKYNTHSELQVDVAAKQKNRFEFAIKSK
jgi:hypothetical protein